MSHNLIITLKHPAECLINEIQEKKKLIQCLRGGLGYTVAALAFINILIVVSVCIRNCCKD